MHNMLIVFFLDALWLRILSLIHQLSLKSIHVTKRDLFYTDVKLFQDQTQSDAVLDDVSCILGCTRSSLNVVGFRVLL